KTEVEPKHRHALPIQAARNQRASMLHRRRFELTQTDLVLKGRTSSCLSLHYQPMQNALVQPLPNTSQCLIKPVLRHSQQTTRIFLGYVNGIGDTDQIALTLAQCG